MTRPNFLNEIGDGNDKLPPFSRPAPVEVPDVTTEATTCTACKAELAPGTRFCPQCGANQQVAATQPTPEAAPAVKAKVELSAKPLDARRAAPAVETVKPGKSYKGPVFLIALMAIGAIVFWPSSKPAPAPAQVAATGTNPKATAPVAGAPAATEPAAPVTAPTQAPVTLDAMLTAKVTEEERGVIKRQIEAVYTAWPADKRRCEDLSQMVVGSEWPTRLCGAVGAEKFFKCSPSALVWDVTIPGCDL